MKWTLLLISTILLFACNKQPLADAQWLVGTWKMSNGEKDMLEVWTQESDEKLLGKSFLIRGKDTILSETMEIRWRSGSLEFAPTVMDQNEGREIIFRADSTVQDYLSFVNPNHDFPQRVVYTHPKSDSMHAFIDGVMGPDKTYKKISFKLKRQ